MIKGFSLSQPFFELGPKAYMWGIRSLALALQADRISEQYNIPIIYSAQYTDISVVAERVKNILVFAQHIDPVRPGRGIGAVLPEAVKDAGAVGTLLNHTEKKLSFQTLEETIRRADETGLATVVCADDMHEAIAVAKLAPNIIIVESPDLIGKKTETVVDRLDIGKVDERIHSINPDIQVLHGAGIYSPEHVREMIMLGAKATGCTSAVMNAENPAGVLEGMIKAMRETWDQMNGR